MTYGISMKTGASSSNTSWSPTLEPMARLNGANDTILDALKKRLYEKKEKHPGKWLKELPAVVWRLWTRPSRNTGVSPYYLVYGSEAILLADIAFRAPRVENFDTEKLA